ncbi:putative calcium-binding protein CML16 [Zea mays]|uniref:Putative calcium-binding protein CML16 n=1 Tax=Zea mays TaxID=4577 RepID=A0A3L6DTQ3_MAIZE|nr:putative calcium-binding protein CML16 [Zea mays]
MAMSSSASKKQAQAQAQAQKAGRRPPAVSSAAAADAEMQRVFSRIDADGDGRISPSELAAVSRAISPPASSSHGRREVAAMMEELDTDRDGFVDLGEFRAFHARGGGVGGDDDDDAELRAAFAVYDADGDGRITAAELGSVLARIGEGCSAEECRRMIAGVDADGDGCVGFEEFKMMMRGPQPQPQAGAGVTAVPDKAKEE